ncbi:MAG: glycosyltransferase family 2 protein [Sedimentisphaeraceae bacterium JB056]
MKNRLTISAVIPAYNNGKYISRAIESVLSQTYPVCEVIVVDDGSTDETKAVVAEFGDQVRYIYKENGGASSARNAGIMAAKGEWIAFLDSDDQWLENRVNDQVELLSRNPSLNWVCSNYITCLCLNGQQSPYNPVRKVDRILNGSESINYYNAFINGILTWTGTMLIKRSTLVESGCFDPDLRVGEDLDMWWRIACRWPEIGVVAEPGAIYHMQVEGSITKAKFPAALYCELILRHRGIAEEYGHRPEFDKMASFMVKRWLRSMLLHRQRADDVRFLLSELKVVIPLWYQILIRTAVFWPHGTESLLRSISRFLRLTKLRKRLVPPPDKMNRK